VKYWRYQDQNDTRHYDRESIQYITGNYNNKCIYKFLSGAKLITIVLFQIYVHDQPFLTYSSSSATGKILFSEDLKFKPTKILDARRILSVKTLLNYLHISKNLTTINPQKI
jgi:hypothetical protein